MTGLRPAGPAEHDTTPVNDLAHLSNILGVVALDVVSEFARAVQAATGLSRVQATALSALANSAEGGSIDQLRRSVDLSHSAAVRLVDRLVDRGLVVRGPSDDGRVAAVHLTPAGRETAVAAQSARRSVLDDVVSRVPANRRRALTDVLDALAAREVEPAPAGVAHADYVCRLCDAPGCGHPDRCPVTAAVRG